MELTVPSRARLASRTNRLDAAWCADFLAGVSTRSSVPVSAFPRRAILREFRFDLALEFEASGADVSSHLTYLNSTRLLTPHKD